MSSFPVIYYITLLVLSGCLIWVVLSSRKQPIWIILEHQITTTRR